MLATLLLSKPFFVCIENESDSAISATSNQQSSTTVHIQLKDETKSVKAAKLTTEFVAKVFICMTSLL